MILKEKISKQQIVDLEKFADKLLMKYDIDVEFSRHFVDRINDDRNNPDITISELQSLFKKIAKKKGGKIKDEKWIEAVLKDIKTEINLPVAIDYIAGEFVVTAKTVMRKKNFQTSSKIITVEDYLNERNYGSKWQPKDNVDFFKNNSYRRVYAGADGKLMKQMKRLTAILNDLETDKDLKNESVSYEIVEGFEKLLFQVERTLNKLKINK